MRLAIQALLVVALTEALTAGVVAYINFAGGNPAAGIWFTLIGGTVAPITIAVMLLVNLVERNINEWVDHYNTHLREWAAETEQETPGHQGE